MTEEYRYLGCTYEVQQHSFRGRKWYRGTLWTIKGREHSRILGYGFGSLKRVRQKMEAIIEAAVELEDPESCVFPDCGCRFPGTMYEDCYDVSVQHPLGDAYYGA
jgi:hypothetical protein